MVHQIITAKQITKVHTHKSSVIALKISVLSLGYQYSTFYPLLAKDVIVVNIFPKSLYVMQQKFHRETIVTK